jgi:hypothetical protein
MILVCASLSVAAAPAHAENSDNAEPHFAPFEVNQSPPRGGHAITRFNVAGEPVSLHAYGRKARARMHDASQEVEAARQQSAAFDPRTRPAVVTFEARLSF